QHGPDLGVDRERMRFRYRMRDRDEFDAELADIDATARRHHRDRDLRRIALGLALGLEQGRAELRRIDRASQLRPEINDRAEMIFVGMRQHKADQVLALFLEKADVRHDEVDAWQMFLITKGDAEVDCKPRALLAFAEAIDRQVHADLADAAERRKGQFVRPCHQLAPMEAAEPK